MSDPAPKRRWFRLWFLGLLMLVAIGIAGISWVNSIRHANEATAAANKAIELYRAQVVHGVDVTLASHEALDADLAVPNSSRRLAYEAHMRRMGEMRRYAEAMYPGSGMVRPIVEFTSHYELARHKLAKVAGEEYAKAVDDSFDFPYRDQQEGHPAAEVGK